MDAFRNDNNDFTEECADAIEPTLALRRGCRRPAGALLAACGGGSDDSAAPQAGSDRAHALAIAAPSQARWSPRFTLPLVPAAAANLPDGRVLLWSAEERFSFGAIVGRTYTATFDPATGTSTERTVTETGHNMFCPGTTNLADGRLLVNGGISAANTSIYDPVANTWTTGAAMNIARGYNANTILAHGEVLTLGGSWSGNVGNKHGEIWSASGGWRRMSGIPVDPMLSADSSRNFGGDSHFWLIPTGHGRVLHAGPGVAMHLIDTRGSGAVQPIGPRGDDQFSVSGTTVMYDIRKVLKAGGAPLYEGADANRNAYIIGMGSGGATVRKLAPMNYARVFHNSVVLPNGQVVLIGGQTRAAAFTDDRSVLAPELFDPVTETFTPLPPMTVPRNYHSSALLLPDARVLATGGGLCGAGCAANHPDVEILSPHYLFNADGSPAVRPVITAAPTQAAHGTSMAVTTNAPVTAFALVRMSSTTHTVNNDQRRVPLQFTASGPNAYSVQVPSNAGIALPGLHWSGNFDELQDFEGQIRALAQGTGLMTDAQFNTGTRSQPLGTAKAGVSADLDALAPYVASLSDFEPSPRRNADGTLTADALAGRSVFAAQCASCHGGAGFTSSTLGVLRHVGTLKPASGMRLGGALTGLDTPTLRDAWQTAPYLHDGSAATIAEAISAHNNVALSATQLAQVSAFVAPVGSEEPAVVPSGNGGLLGEYFNNLTLAGAPALTRVEAVDFGWGTGSPGPAVGSDNFSARWTGSVLAPATGSYRFRTVSDDGVRLWVNGVQVINNWTDHAATTNTSRTVNLVAGQRYTIRLEYYERTGQAVLRLQWLRPGVTTYAAIPAASLYASPP